MRRLPATLFLIAACFGGAAARAAPGPPPGSEGCLSCHGAKDGGPPFVDARAFARSPHGARPCSSCHADVKEFPHPSPVKKVDCGACHAVEAKKFSASVHGRASARGARAAPNCVDCHGEHDIRAPSEAGSRVARADRAKTCAGCHRSARLSGLFGDRVRSFESSFHGMAVQGGDAAVADCASCHGWHDVLASGDVRSRTHPANIARTCGQCHEGAGKRWGDGRVLVHETLAQRGAGSRLAAFATAFYGVAIPMTVLGMLFHNGLDLGRKMLGPRVRRRRRGEVPLSRCERWQHAATAAGFALLAYSGFALHDPSAWWARPSKRSAERRRAATPTAPPPPCS